ncbi:FecCD family ABC transporter permease [Lacrimispora sp.]|uniref:FecCD family ABC transporter permease n=1 Tax=Lacrimispora sp. TaxID=2719234 RepID=UPI00399442D8
MTNHIDHIALIEKGQKKRKKRYRIVEAVLLVLAVILCGLMMTVGNTFYSLKTVVQVLAGKDMEHGVFAILTLRLPRMMAGIITGFSFGLAGSVFQTMLRNPLANPNIIGITSASSAGAVFCIVILHAGGSVVFGGSILAAAVTAILIYFLSKLKKYSTGRLILVGIGFQALMNSAVSYFLLIGNANDIAGAIRWMSGSLNGVQMPSVYLLLLVTVVCVPFILYYSKALKILELGEESAITMGVHTNQARGILLVASVILVAVATATTGPIAFVSFLSGPIAKRMTGYGNSSPVIAGGFGAVLVLAADMIGQQAFAIRFPVGVITGLLGAPYLIYLLIRMNRHGEF